MVEEKSQYEMWQLSKGARAPLIAFGLIALVFGAGAASADPLMGQGIAPQEATPIYVSFFLEKLLDVDEQNMKFEVSPVWSGPVSRCASRRE